MKRLTADQFIEKIDDAILQNATYWSFFKWQNDEITLIIRHADDSDSEYFERMTG